MLSLVECVPNFSEGRRPEVVEQIVAAIRAVSGVAVLDFSLDHDHNRSVVTFAGSPSAVEQAAFQAIRAAAELIDLDHHQGEHPRIGATDVVPFIPIRGVTMDDCVQIAWRLGQRVGEELHIPVYLYEKAATRPDRENLADLRKGEYEGLRDAIKTDPDRAPDFGPVELGPAGATVIGARLPLIAYNVYLNTDDVEIASKVAKAIRHSSGGLRYVKALGLSVEGRAQVSMNLTDYTRTPIHRAQDLIRSEAARYGCAIAFAELIGLIPEQALVDAARWYLQLDRFADDQILERKIQSAEAEDFTPHTFIDATAAGTPAPGGGSVAALAGALSAALAGMVARLTIGKKKYADVEPTMQDIARAADSLRAELTALIAEDSRAFMRVMAAFKLDKDDPARPAAIQQATLYAADIPLKTARTALEALRLLQTAATQGNANAATDAAVGVHMALAAVEGASLNVLVNLRDFEDKNTADRLRQEIIATRATARDLAPTILVAVEDRLGLA